MKNIKKNSIILLLITIIVLVYILKDNFVDIINELLKMKVSFLIIAIVFIIIYWLLKALSIYIIARKYSDKIKLKKLFSLTVITQFFNGVTPFSTGGQPMQIYMLNKNNISVAKSTNIVLQDFIVYQIALVLYGVFAIITNIKLNLFVNTVYLNKLVVLGFVINTIVCIVVFLICFSKSISKVIILLVIKIGKFIRIIKDEEKINEKLTLKTEEFQTSAMMYIKNKKLFFTGIVINILALTIFYSIPFILFKGMGIISDMTLLTVIITSAYVLLIGSFVPIPGGSLGIEYAFLVFFGNFIFGTELSALLLIWRFITYYFGIILGGLIFNIYKVGD